MEVINTILLLYAIYRLHLNGTAPKPPIRVVAPSNAGQEWNKPVEKTEQPKAGTVAAKAIKPVVYLSQVPHKTVNLDNGGLEWEGKS